MKIRGIQITGIVLSLLVFIDAFADTIQSLERIEQAAYEFVLSKAQETFDSPRIVMGKLDSRLRLKPCDSHLHVFSKSGIVESGNQIIGVSCDRPVVWTVYIPVQVKVLDTIAVAAKTLSTNHILTRKDIQFIQRDIAGLQQSYITKPEQIIGQQLKYPVVSGTILTSRLIRPQKVVRRGELIILVAKAGAMEVRMTGTAMADASVGQRVRVKNSSSKRIVEGIVEAPGVVKVMM